jgi:hypothetical protein
LLYIFPFNWHIIVPSYGVQYDNLIQCIMIKSVLISISFIVYILIFLSLMSLNSSLLVLHKTCFFENCSHLTVL